MLLTSTSSYGARHARPVALLTLIRSEYLEMPGLSVTLPQAARLWNVDTEECSDALETLVRDGFLRKSRAMYLRATCGAALM